MTVRTSRERSLLAALFAAVAVLVFSILGDGPSGLASALAITAPGGTIVQVGMLPRGDSPAPLNRVVAKELRVIGTFRFYREYAEAVAALVDGRVDVTPMLTHQFAFSDVLKAFAVAADRRQAMKVTLSPE